MFEKLHVRRNMEVADQYGKFVGTVDHIEDDRMELTPSGHLDRVHHFIAFDHIDRIANNRVYLKDGVAIPVGARFH